MSDQPLTDEEIKTALLQLPGWARDGDVITKTFNFPDFRAALAFMVRAGFEAEAQDHHPEWTNVYNRVDIRLNTHSAGGKVTAKDTALAEAMEKLAPSLVM